jgi:hypothetical protein
MSLENLLKKIIKGWWIIVLTLVIAGIYTGLQSNKGNTYLTSVSFGFSPVMTQTNNTITNDNYPTLMIGISQYLEARLSSTNMQEILARRSGVALSTDTEQKSVYKVKSQQMGFVTINYTANNKVEAENFIKGVEEVSQILLSEWNNERPSQYSVKSVSSFKSSTVPSTSSKQLIFLPFVVAIVLGLGISIILPEKNIKK